jgi:tetratricopeptide (TPR) repeat protein
MAAMKRNASALRFVLAAAAALALWPAPGLAAKPSGDRPEAGAAEPERLILADDIDGFVAYLRKTEKDGAHGAASSLILAVDDVSQGQYDAATAELDAGPGALRTTSGDLLEMWILLTKGDAQHARWRAEDAQTRLPPRLANLAPALVLEASGKLEDAAKAYDKLEATLDESPPLRGEPASLDESLRALDSPRLAQILYRDAVVHHRLGRKDEAIRLYLLADQYAPNSPDIAANIERLKRGAPPFDPPLDARAGLGRWLLFLSYEFTLAETLHSALANPIPPEGLAAPTASIFAELGLKLDPAAHDWLIATAGDLAGAGGYEGAARLLARVPADSVFAADAKLVEARAALRRGDDARAADAALRARDLGKDRWAVVADSGLMLSSAGHDAEALAALNAAVEATADGGDRAAALLDRAAVHFQAGRIAAAVADARAAMTADPSDDVRESAIGFLWNTPDGWDEAIRIGRELLTARPNSVERLNTLGYALIQRDAGLNEGFKMLSRGASLNPNYYAVIDSLGWAYYLYGDFEQARRLVARAHELMGTDANPEVLDHLGDIFWRLGRSEDAKAAWREALAAHPDARRRAALMVKVAKGLATPAPVKREPPKVEAAPKRAAPLSPI